MGKELEKLPLIGPAELDSYISGGAYLSTGTARIRLEGSEFKCCAHSLDL